MGNKYVTALLSHRKPSVAIRRALRGKPLPGCDAMHDWSMCTTCKREVPMSALDEDSVCVACTARIVIVEDEPEQWEQWSEERRVVEARATPGKYPVQKGEVMTFQIGDKVVWVYHPRSGWFDTARVKATVVGFTKSRVIIDVDMRDGSTTRRTVQLKNLEKREGYSRNE